MQLARLILWCERNTSSSMVSEFLKALFPERLKRRIKSQLGVPSLEGSLNLLRANGFHPRLVLDIGAYTGEWTALCQQIWPQAAVLMIEAHPERARLLEKKAASWSRVKARQALLGSAPKASVPFYEQESASSVLPESAKRNQASILLAMETLDDVLIDTSCGKADLLKLDVQGYELEILRGGRKAIPDIEVILIEVNLIAIYQGAPLVRETVDYLGDAGFRLYDVATLYRRPLDGALWQADFVFAREGSKLNSSVRYE